MGNIEVHLLIKVILIDKIKRELVLEEVKQKLLADLEEQFNRMTK